jgi:hypothetical protein
MQIISRRTHGILDYVVGVVLILAPRFLGLEAGGVEARILMVLGWAAVVYSVFTRYELGLIKVLPFSAHLGLDVMSGLLLIVSPWLFQFADRVWAPHVVFGLIELGAVMLTRRSASEHDHVPGAPVAH